MCGIAGIVNTENRPVDAGVLAAMSQALFHRGPDEVGLHFEPGLGLGHRRLSIIDLSTGQQPLCNEDGSVVIVYNGEIYNYRDLIPELTRLGHVFRTKSDTEVIVHGWEQWGEDCVERFRGMFAFALWDRNRETLFLARDRLGVKPLYYALLGDGTLVFGSELKSLLAEAFRKRTSAEWLEALEAADILCSPVNSLQQALDDPQVRYNQMVIEFEHPQGTLRAIGSPVKLTDTPASVRRPPPLLGEHDDEILSELGFVAEQIAELRRARVIQ